MNPNPAGLPFNLEIHLRLAILDMYRRFGEASLERTRTDLQERLARVLGSNADPKRVFPFLFEDFPRYQRYSFVSLLASVTEAALEELCRELGDRRNLSLADRYQTLKGKQVDTCPLYLTKGFLKRHLIADCPTRKQQWKALDDMWKRTIEFLRILRNCLVHTEGTLNKVRNRHDKVLLERQAITWAGCSIQGERILLEAEFCEKVTSEVVSLFAHIFTVFPMSGDYERGSLFNPASPDIPRTNSRLADCVMQTSGNFSAAASEEGSREQL